MSLHASLRRRRILGTKTSIGQACASRRKRANKMAKIQDLTAEARICGVPVAVLVGERYSEMMAQIRKRQAEAEEEARRELNRYRRRYSW